MAEDQHQWLARLKKRDEEAIGDLVRDHATPIRRYLAGLLRSEADAEDLAQDTLVRFLDGLDAFRGDCSVKTYLFRIAHNLALNHLASAPVTREVAREELPEAPDGLRPPVDAAMWSEAGESLRRALGDLPPQQRAVVILRTWQDLSFREIGEVLSVAEGTAKAHYFFGLRNLRKRLEVTHVA